MRIAICDDNRICRARVEDLMHDYCEQRRDRDVSFSVFSEPEALLAAHREKPFDIYVLDIVMPGMNGIELGTALREDSPDAKLIYLTSSEEYALDSFRVRAFDYLMKPFKIERVIQTLERVRERLRMRINRPHTPQVAVPRAASGRMMLRHREGVTFVDYEDILLVQREERSTVIYTRDEERFVTSDSLGEMEERLPKDVFFRCHKSYIINLNHIKDITPYGRWTYVVRLEGTQHDALITHEKYEELERMFQ